MGQRDFFCRCVKFVGMISIGARDSMLQSILNYSRYSASSSIFHLFSTKQCSSLLLLAEWFDSLFKLD